MSNDPIGKTAAPGATAYRRASVMIAEFCKPDRNLDATNAIFREVMETADPGRECSELIHALLILVSDPNFNRDTKRWAELFSKWALVNAYVEGMQL